MPIHAIVWRPVPGLARFSRTIPRLGLVFACTALAITGCRTHHATPRTTTPPESAEIAAQTSSGQRTPDIDALQRNETVVAALKGPSPSPTGTPRPPHPSLTAYTLAPNGQIWLATSAGDIVESFDGGKSWSPLSRLDHVRALAFPSAYHAWVGTDDGLWHSSDGGRTWRRVTLEMDGPADHLRFADSDHGELSVGAFLFVTIDAGATWTATGRPCAALATPQYPTIGRLRSIWFTDHLDGWVLCDGQPSGGVQDKWLYRTVDGGHNFGLVADATGLEPIPHRASGNLLGGGYANNVFFLDAQHGWISVTRGNLEATSDGGFTWARVIDNANVPDVLQAQFVTLDHAYAISNGDLVESTDGGQTWRMLYAP